MTREEVVELMKSSKNNMEWNNNCDKVKKAFDGQYPNFWWEAIIQSGIAAEVLQNAKIEIF